jgi:hypothetical protein
LIEIDDLSHAAPAANIGRRKTKSQQTTCGDVDAREVRLEIVERVGWRPQIRSELSMFGVDC